MKRLVLGGLAAIALLLAGSLLLLDRLARDGSPGRGAGGEAVAAGEEGARGRLAEAPKAPPGLAEAMQRQLGDGGGLSGPDFARNAPRAPPRAPPPPDSWEAVPVSTTRARGKDPVAAVLARELADLHEQLSGCFDPAVAARVGAAAPTRTLDDLQDESGVTVLVLQVEVQHEAIRVVGAPAAASGGASDATLACAQSLLVGKSFQAPGVRAGGRRRVQHSLIP